MSRSKVLLVAVVIAVLAGGAGASLAATGAAGSGSGAAGAGPHHEPRPRVRAGRSVPARRHPLGRRDRRCNTARNFPTAAATASPPRAAPPAAAACPTARWRPSLSSRPTPRSRASCGRTLGGAPTATILAYQNGLNLLNTGTLAVRGHPRGGPVDQVVPGVDPRDHRRERLLHPQPLRLGRPRWHARRRFPSRPLSGLLKASTRSPSTVI